MCLIISNNDFRIFSCHFVPAVAFQSDLFTCVFNFSVCLFLALSILSASLIDLWELNKPGMK